MTRRAHLSFAELLERRIPLSAGEAVALTLAVWQAADRAGAAVPADAEILLSSTGQVTCASSSSGRSDETERLASLLQRLLYLHDGEVARRSHVPGGLLMVLARTLRQIDVPPLAPDAFRDALSRFACPEPALLASIFWRAARMRPRRRHGSGAAVHQGGDRRVHGPSTTELRRWIRQTERELFTLRRSRSVVAGAAAALALVAVTAFGIGAALGSDPRQDMGQGSQSIAGPAVPAPGAASVTAAPAATVTAGEREVEAADAVERLPPGSSRVRSAPVAPPSAERAIARGQSTIRRSAPTPVPPKRRVTVDMVNLPRAPWAVVRRLDSDGRR